MDLEFLTSFMFWSFVAVAIVLAVVGQVAKRLILGKDEKEAVKSKWKLAYKESMMIHPVVLGGTLGFFLSESVPEVVKTGGVAASVLYFALAGAISSWVYDLVKRAVRNLNLTPPGSSGKDN